MHITYKDDVAAELCIYMLNIVSLSSHCSPFVSLWVCGYKRKWRSRQTSPAPCWALFVSFVSWFLIVLIYYFGCGSQVINSGFHFYLGPVQLNSCFDIQFSCCSLVDVITLQVSHSECNMRLHSFFKSSIYPIAYSTTLHTRIRCSEMCWCSKCTTLKTNKKALNTLSFIGEMVSTMILVRSLCVVPRESDWM